MSKTDFAFWLGVYAAVVASATGLWSLFRELWLERARLYVTPEEAWLVRAVTPQGEPHPLIIKGEVALRTVNPPAGARRPILTVTIRNRGRRAATIESISQALPEGGSFIFGDVLRHLPISIPSEQSTQLIAQGDLGDYQHGDVALRRFYVVDGAGRIHPLRERYRRRLRRLFRRPTSPPPVAPEEPTM